MYKRQRQSRDRVVTEKILSMTEGKPLWMSAYSRRIFPEDAPVCVAEDLVGKLAEPARKDAEQVESAQEMCIRDRPWTDLTKSGKSYQTRSSVDPVLDHEYLDRMIENYAGGMELTNPYISPLFGKLEGLPPVYIPVSYTHLLLQKTAETIWI